VSRYQPTPCDAWYKLGLWLNDRIPKGHCRWCLKFLTGRQRSYCASVIDKDGYSSQKCAFRFQSWHYQRPAYQIEVLVRDNFTCQECGFNQPVSGAPHLMEMINFHVHHLKPYAKGGNSKPENLITLCEDCHKKWHKEHREPAQ
jgi:5-methylcytosine-specific restriction endonuclease McrA